MIDSEATAMIESLQEWLKACDSHHTGTCVAPTSSSTQLSSRSFRLIDVENQCIVRGDVQGPYLALSYIWQDDLNQSNEQQQFQLSLNNFEALTLPDSLRLYSSQLPKTILDAMELTIAIRKRYLWVDRLCIVQDDPRKEEEVKRMDQIYSGAYLTIIAAAKNGFYHTTNGTVQNPAFDSADSVISRFVIKKHGRIKEYYRNVSRSRWAKRAWTYQEYILSKRVVFFLDTGIFWQCECAVWDKDPLRPEQDGEVGNAAASDLELIRSFSVPAWPDFGLYADLICPYNGRDLSYSKDGLSACSGILDRLTPAFPNGFLFGLPRFYLDHALLWQPLGAHYESYEFAVVADGCPGRMSLSTRRSNLPSWAWCGWQCFVDPQISLAALNLSQDGQYRVDPTSSWRLHKTITWESVATSMQDPVNVSVSLTLSSHISALAPRAFFFPAAVLEIRFQAGWRRKACAGFIRASQNPVLSDEKLLEKPQVVVLRDRSRRFSGLLRVTGNSECKRGETMELIAISRGSAHGKDFKHCFEERVFSLSRYRDAEAFWPKHDDKQWWVDTSHMTPSPGECHYRVVATGDYETDLKVEEKGYTEDQEYEFYNVLWVQQGNDGIKYRAGCGRILAKYWEENNPLNTQVTLG